MDRNIAKYVGGVHHLHTFNQPGKYIIKSDVFRDRATVIVCSDISIKSQSKNFI
jgi:hypothetical protein